MASQPPSLVSHDGLSRPDLEFQRFEYLPSPRVSADGQASNTEAPPQQTVATPEHTQELQTDTKPKKSRFDWEGSWAWEIGSLALAVVGVALLVAFLATINSTPYGDWQYTASPNTVVSIIITITKAALLVPVSSCLGQLKWNLFQNPAPLYQMQVIDQASRGPWGSLEILLRGIIGPRTGILTYIGAALTVLALAVDPFAQQILTFPQRTVPALNATASIQTSREWFSPSDDLEYEIESGLSPTLLTSVMSGLMQIHSPLEPQCNSTSCEFPEFVTLGMCSRCEDATAQTNQKCEVPEFSPYLDTVDEGLTKAPINCSYATPNGFSFEFEELDSAGIGADNVGYRMNHWSLRPRYNDPALELPSPMFDIQTPISSFIAVNYSMELTYTVSNGTLPPPRPSVTECTVYFCERKYAATSYRPGDQSSRPVHPVNIQQLVPTDALDHVELLPSTGPVHFAPPSGSAALSKNSTYAVDHRTFSSLQATLQSFFNGTTYTLGGIRTTDASRIATILRTPNLGHLLESMSASATDTVRTNARGSMIPGEPFRDETFIRVRWPWIILPVVVALGSIVLLVATAIGSKQKKAVLWKSTVLPLITSKFDTTPENGIASVRSVDGMTDMSKKMRAVVIQDDGPITFQEREN